MENFELYLIVILILVLLGFIMNTFTYYRDEKRKLKNLHRFAKEGEIEAQQDLAKHYKEGKMLKKDTKKADFWQQKAYFSSDKIARAKPHEASGKNTNQKK